MKYYVFFLGLVALVACSTANKNRSVKDAPAIVDLAGKKYCRMISASQLLCSMAK